MKKRGEKFKRAINDLAFQRVQEALTPGVSSLALLGDKLVKDVQKKL